MKHYVPRPRLLVLVLALAALLAPALVRPSLAAVPYANLVPIAFSGDAAAGPALTYPSTIDVAGLNGSITRLSVTLTGIGYNYWDNLDIMLVGPDGKQVMLMSDAGGSLNTTTLLSPPLTLTFDDGAAAALPTDNTVAITSGTYRPTNYQTGDVFPAPAPGSTANTSLGVFNRTDPNGTWKLFAVEDNSGSSGAIAGWSLSFETADLAVDVADFPLVNAGDLLGYTVTALNRGTESVANPQLTIDVPANTVFQSVLPPLGWSCPAPAAGAPITCTTPSMLPVVPASFLVTVRVDKALLPNASITRTASITSGVSEADTANNSDTATTTVTTLADLAVTGVDSPATIDAGAVMPIDVTVQNNGPSNAADVVVVMAVPAGTTYDSVNKPDGWSCEERAAQPTGREVACTLPVFSTEAAAFKLFVKVDPAAVNGTPIAALARISAGTADLLPLVNNVGSDVTLVTTRTDLAVAVTASPDPVSAASELTYKIDVTNNGPSAALNATLDTAVQLGTTFTSIEPPAGWTCGTTPAVGGIGAVSCTNPSFGVGSASFTLKVKVLSGASEGEIVTLNAGVASDTTDSDNTNDSATARTPVTIAADLSVALDGVGPAVKSGSTIIYNIKVNNSGPEIADNVSVTATTPANTTFVSLAAPAGWTCTTPASGGAGGISCANPGLDVAMETLVLTVKVGDFPNGTPVALTASVATGANTDKNLANNSATLSSQVAVAADMSVRVGGPTRAIRPNALLNYTLEVRNAGPENASGAQLSLTTPAHTTFVSLTAPAGWTCTTPAPGATGAITCSSASFGMTTATFALTLKADKVSEDATITLNAAVAATSQDLVTANNTHSLSTPLLARYRINLPIVRR